MCFRKTEGWAFRENTKGKGNKMALVRVIKVKEGKAKLRELLKDRLAKNGAKAAILIGKLAADKSIVWRPTELDEVANELRHLACQIRNDQNAKLATEEA